VVVGSKIKANGAQPSDVSPVIQSNTMADPIREEEKETVIRSTSQTIYGLICHMKLVVI
jgi:hypothetical protein